MNHMNRRTFTGWLMGLPFAGALFGKGDKPDKVVVANGMDNAARWNEYDPLRRPESKPLRWCNEIKTFDWEGEPPVENGIKLSIKLICDRKFTIHTFRKAIENSDFPYLLPPQPQGINIRRLDSHYAMGVEWEVDVDVWLKHINRCVEIEVERRLKT